MKRFYVPGVLVLLLTLLSSSAVFAKIDLKQAKDDQLVGETTTGYVEAVKAGVSVEIEQLVKDVNLQRKAAYRKIAAKNGSSLQAVEAVAGKKLVEKATSGQWVKGSDGKWLQVK